VPNLQKTCSFRLSFLAILPTEIGLYKFLEWRAYLNGIIIINPCQWWCIIHATVMLLDIAPCTREIIKNRLRRLHWAKNKIFSIHCIQNVVFHPVLKNRKEKKIYYNLYLG